jgi:hypothetical protein
MIIGQPWPLGIYGAVSGSKGPGLEIGSLKMLQEPPDPEDSGDLGEATLKSDSERSLRKIGWDHFLRGLNSHLW